MKKRGVTLIEVVVSMGVFAIVTTIIVGAFVLVLNMKALTSTMKETQQKLRMAIEITSRLSRQAKDVDLEIAGAPATGGIGDSVILLLDNTQATKFVIGPLTTGDPRSTLYTQDCILVGGTCPGWVDLPKNDLLSGEIRLNSGSQFEINFARGSTPTISIKLNGEIPNIKSFYQNTFNIDNTVILESLEITP